MPNMKVMRETNKRFFRVILFYKELKQRILFRNLQYCRTCDEVKVENLIDHTATRVILHLREVVQSLSDDGKLS